ncbi:AAA family ATPase [Gluconacetobacter entanii]|uniref:nucleotide-binding protein n=1 Tax=Gluconacetobacter entanii TaxID=108528 RepID=UPI001C935235|nr:AAA family ATPase [Gluconacetobacter entanii]MBY4639753.1 AAA family ATPase [Gluconacetobacter entanii]MCW4579469.1 AAA family ATPase [Gluconacetobacter entanii]MCW4582878.1 AAA family ATPase [Gluconacetobacter entanii]MCW4586271.1 AAA family ATPase [Gluconacetobacter entanii]
MRTVAFLSQKGGSGKTTMAVHTAVAAQADGETVSILDSDPQKSATGWGRARGEDDPRVEPVSALGLADALKKREASGVTLSIVDTAPHAAPEAARIAGLVDFIIIPVRPTAFDLAAAGRAAAIAKAAGKPAAFVLSAAPSRVPEVEEARQALGHFGLPVAPVTIADRIAYSRAVSSGSAVSEMEPRGKAASETKALWKWIKGNL